MRRYAQVCVAASLAASVLFAAPAAIGVDPVLTLAAPALAPSLQSLSGGLGASSGAAFNAGGWQRIAVANGIENPRALAPGQFIDLSAQRPRIVTG